MIDANTLGVINQNSGYDGYENNIPQLAEVPAELFNSRNPVKHRIAEF